MLLKSWADWRKTFFSWSDIFASMELWCLFSFLLLNSWSSTSHTLPFLVRTRVKYLWSDRLCRMAFLKDRIKTRPDRFFWVLMLIHGEHCLPWLLSIISYDSLIWGPHDVIMIYYEWWLYDSYDMIVVSWMILKSATHRPYYCLLFSIFFRN